jgi:hypothetical protein
MAAKKAAKRTPAKKPASGKRTKAAAKKAVVKKAVPKKYAKRADLGAPIDGFFAKQPPALRAILDVLREIVDRAAPDAEASLKWGMPFYTVGGGMMCALGAHKGHVNLILAGAPDTFDDPEGRLTGEGKTGRHLKLTTVEEIPRKAVEGWVRTAAKRARES